MNKKFSAKGRLSSGQKKQLKGIALRDSYEKSVLLEIASFKIHPIYKKRYTVTHKILAHADMEVKKDQVVLIQETRPISKKKAWKVVEVIQ